MSDAVGSGGDIQNALYWKRRELELTKLANALYSAVHETHQHQQKLTRLGETEKMGSEQWESAMADARKSLTAARTLRSRFRRQIYAMRDTLRIRPYLAQDAPPHLIEALQKGVEYINYLEAHGF